MCRGSEEGEWGLCGGGARSIERGCLCHLRMGGGVHGRGKRGMFTLQQVALSIGGPPSQGGVVWVRRTIVLRYVMVLDLCPISCHQFEACLLTASHRSLKTSSSQLLLLLCNNNDNVLVLAAAARSCCRVGARQIFRPRGPGTFHRRPEGRLHHLDLDLLPQRSSSASGQPKSCLDAS